MYGTQFVKWKIIAITQSVLIKIKIHPVTLILLEYSSWHDAICSSKWLIKCHQKVHRSSKYFFQILNLCISDTPCPISYVPPDQRQKLCYAVCNTTHVLYGIRVFIGSYLNICKNVFLIYTDHNFIILWRCSIKSEAIIKTQKCNCFHHPSHWYTSGKRGWKTLLIKPFHSYANQSLFKTQFYGTSSVLLSTKHDI